MSSPVLVSHAERDSSRSAWQRREDKENRRTQGVPRQSAYGGRTQMGTTKRICISQHMSQHIMKLMLSLRIVRSPLGIFLLG